MKPLSKKDPRGTLKIFQRKHSVKPLRKGEQLEKWGGSARNPRKGALRHRFPLFWGRRSIYSGPSPLSEVVSAGPGGRWGKKRLLGRKESGFRRGGRRKIRPKRKGGGREILIAAHTKKNREGKTSLLKKKGGVREARFGRKRFLVGPGGGGGNSTEMEKKNQIRNADLTRGKIRWGGGGGKCGDDSCGKGRTVKGRKFLFRKRFYLASGLCPSPWHKGKPSPRG